MEVNSETLKRLYKLNFHEFRVGSSANILESCLTLEKLLDLPAFDFLASKELAAHYRAMYSTKLEEMGYRE